MAYVLELSNEDKLPRFKLEEGTTTWWGQEFGNGEQVDPNTVTSPLMATQIDKNKFKYDIFRASSKYCVSKRAQEIIEKN